MNHLPIPRIQIDGTELEVSEIWKGTHKRLAFHIQRWWTCDYSFSDRSDMKHVPIWNYYVYIPEQLALDFPSLWLEDQLKDWGITHDYYKPAFNEADWHGGVTYYKKYDNIPGRRVVEIGCDFNHLYDQDRREHYTIESVARECFTTINQLQSLLIPPTDLPSVTMA